MNVKEQIFDALNHCLLSPLLQDELQTLNSSLDSRAQIILWERVLAESHEAKTLQQVADQFKVTREAVRLIEIRLLKQIRSFIAESCEYSSWVGIQIQDKLGAIVPFQYLPPDLILNLKSPSGRWARFVAGGYTISSDFSSHNADDLVMYSKDNKVGLRKFLRSILAEQTSQTSGLWAKDVLIETLVSKNVAPWIAREIVSTHPDIGHYEDFCFSIPASINEKFKLFLQLTEIPQTFESALQFLSSFGKVNLRSLRNAVSSDPEISKISANSFALRSWGMPEFETTVKAIEDFIIENGATDMVTMAEKLNKKFGVKKTSVSMYSQMHPKFKYQDGMVRLRSTSDPVEYGLSIEQESSCIRRGDFWCWRVIVNRDVLRGSGLPIPLALAEHLKLEPEQKIDLDHDLGIVSFSWQGINPAVSSLRIIAEKNSLAEGDYLFLTIDTERNHVIFSWRNGFSPEMTFDENLRNYLCGDREDNLEVVVQRAHCFDLYGEALWDVFEMRAEIVSDLRLLRILEYRNPSNN